MLSKCINPGCSAKFSYLHQGKLFRRDDQAAPINRGPVFGDEPDTKMRPRQIEFFWLCDDCSAAMTLAFDQSEGVMIRPLKRASAASAS